MVLDLPARLGLVLLLLAGFDGRARGQGETEAIAKPGEAETGSRQESAEPSARQILDLAVAAQGHDPESVHPDNLALHVKMNLQFVSDRGDDVTLMVETKFLGGGKDRRRDMIWKCVADNGRKPVTAFDGTRPWTRDSPNSEVIDLRGPEYGVDRERLAEDIELTRTLARLFLLENLARELEDLERLEDQSGSGTTAYVLLGTVKEEGPPGEDGEPGPEQRVRIQLWLEHGTHHLLGCRVDPLEGDREPMTLCFWDWRKKDGRWIPRSIKLHPNDAKEPQQTIYPSLLIVGARLRPSDFSAE